VRLSRIVRPAVADADSELARVVVEGGFGCNVLPGEPASLAETLDRLAADPGQLAAWGKAGRTWVAQFEQNRVLEEFSENLRAKFATA